MHWYPTHVDPHLKDCLIYSHNHHSLLQVTSIRSQTNARNHFLQLRENNWRSKCTHLIHTNDSIQTSCNDLCCVFVETTTCDLKRVRKRFDALMSTLIPQLQFTVGIRNTLHVPSSLQLTIRLSFFNSIYKGCMTFQLSFQSSQLSHHWEVSNYYCRIPHNYVLICTTANYLTSIVVPTYFQNCILMSFQKSVIVTFSIYVPQKYICIHSSSCQVLSIRRKTNCVYCILFNENKNSKSLYVRLVLNWEPSNSMCEEARQDRPICN